MFFRFYPLIVILQVFCLYHVYSNRNEQKWYFIIFFFPFIGSLIYLYITFYSRGNIDKVKEGVKNTFINDYKINKLEKNLKYSDTHNNRILLAEEYSVKGYYKEAIETYNHCNVGLYKDEPDLLLKLLWNHYLDKNYKEVVKFGAQLKGTKDFNRSKEMAALAWSYYYVEDKQKAEETFQKTDIEFANYEHRLEYAYFLSETNKKTECIDLLEKLLNEIDSMDSFEKRNKKQIHRDIKSFYRQVSH